MQKIAIAAAAWLAAITTAHVGLNVDWNILLNDRLPAERRKLYVAYIPVT